MEKRELDSYIEVVSDISMEVGATLYCSGKNSVEVKRDIRAWADEFMVIHKQTDWDEVDYLEQVLDFTHKKIHAQIKGTCEPDLTLRVTEEEGDTLDAQLTPERFPNTYQRKKKELMMNCGMSEEEAEKNAESPIQLELFYSFDQGLFAVEAEGLDSIEIYNPYDGAKIPNDNLILNQEVENEKAE